jgi:hypothetical protein
MQTTNRTYRCTYQPLDRDGIPVPCETGVMPYTVLLAPDAEAAQRLAHDRTKSPICSVERIEPEPLPSNEDTAALLLRDGSRIDLRAPWALPGVPA